MFCGCGCVNGEAKGVRVVWRDQATHTLQATATTTNPLTALTGDKVVELRADADVGV